MTLILKRSRVYVDVDVPEYFIQFLVNDTATTFDTWYETTPQSAANLTPDDVKEVMNDVLADLIP